MVDVVEAEDGGRVAAAVTTAGSRPNRHRWLVEHPRKAFVQLMGEAGQLGVVPVLEVACDGQAVVPVAPRGEVAHASKSSWSGHTRIQNALWCGIPWLRSLTRILSSEQTLGDGPPGTHKAWGKQGIRKQSSLNALRTDPFCCAPLKDTRAEQTHF